MPFPRPVPTRLSRSTAPSPLPPVPIVSPALTWIPVLSTPINFPLTSFFSACQSFVLHPEYNSSTILRCDILLDSDATGAEEGVQLEGWKRTRRVRRKLIPKRKQYDGSMEEECLFFERLQDGGEEGLVLLIPDLKALDEEGKLPYYHPDVSALAFRYLSPTQETRIDLVPLPAHPLSEPLPETDRLYRTCLALLNQLNQVARGVNEGYEKRVVHDLLVDRDSVQDLYRVLKNKYLWLMKEWKEATDPQKHLFEDVAIAAWLILLWREMYGENEERKGPPAGFVDVGCGNGLLVYILTQEGFAGYGVDLRARKTWSLFSDTTDLRTTSLDPITIVTSPGSSPFFPPNSFLIGNHADELTPWMPLFSAVTPGSSYLSIPCCCFELASRFTRTTYSLPVPFLESLAVASAGKPASALMEPFYAPTPSEVNHGGRYFAYQLYLAHLSLMCGFVPEREALRMPSTKNFGILGRNRTWEVAGLGAQEREELEVKVLENVRQMAAAVDGIWVARTPEGNAKDH